MLLNNLKKRTDKGIDILPVSILLLILVIKSTLFTFLLFYQNANYISEWKRSTYFEQSYYWLSLSAEAELGRFGISLLDHTEHSADEIISDPKNIQFRLNILWSRIKLLRSGRFYEWASRDKRASKHIDDLDFIVRTIEADLHAGRLSAFRASALLDDAILHAKSLTGAALQADRLIKEELFDELDLVQLLTKVGTITSLAAAILLAGFAVAYIRNTRREKFYIDRMNQKLETMVDEREYFIKVASHELRNAAQGAVALIDRDWSNDQVIRRETMLSMESFKQNVDSLLDFARSVSDRVDLSYSDFVVGDVISMWASSIGGSESKKILVNDRTLGVEVSAQRAILFRCFQNILVNGVRHAKFVVRINVELVVGESLIRICFHDDGPGIPDRIVDLFNFSDYKPKEVSGSLGIGLLIVKKLLESIGGCIAFPRVKDGGLVVVEFPVIINSVKCRDFSKEPVEAVIRREHLSACHISGDNLKVLYCEDDRDIREAFAHMLRSRFSELDVCGTVEEFMSTRAAVEYDVAILDFSLGDGTAEDICDVIRETNQKCRFIALTGLELDDPKSQGHFDVVLRKPVSFSEICNAIDSVLPPRQAD